MSITKNTVRIGNFSSSEIVALTKVGTRKMTEEELAQHKIDFPKSRKTTVRDGFADTALTYIKEKNMERRLGRSIKSETTAKATTWGHVCEPVAFSKLSFEYNMVSSDTIVHPVISNWVGTPDVTLPNTVGDIKCPFTLKSFCLLVDPIIAGNALGHEGIFIMNAIRENHPDGEKYYWQLVSNAILTGSDYAELIIYMPYESELDSIRQIAIDRDDCNWMLYDELPYLLDGGFYKNMYSVSFVVPEADKELLTECVTKAGEFLE